MQHFSNYINGEWVKTERTLENRNPADCGDLVGTFSQATQEQVNTAAEAAEAAFPGWAATPPPARGALLFKVADILESRLDSLAKEMTREEGKTLPEAKGETQRSINIFRYFGGEGSRLAGPLAPSERPRVFMWAERKPLGVVTLITPWNFPSAIPAWKLAPALLAGNTVLLKPASASPLSAWRLVEACHEAGLPPGVVNFLCARGADVGDSLIQHPAIRAVSFTGSCEVGQALHAKASAEGIRVQLEMGGKNPTIVLADANLAEAVANTVNASMFSTGQKCTATSRVIVEAAIYDEFTGQLIEAVKNLKVGDGLAEGVQIGPAIDRQQLETNLNYCQIAEAEGAKIECGGQILSEAPYDKGHFFAPTVITGVTNDMRIAREEVFGPVLAVLKAQDFEEAIDLANDTEFGLSASIQTQNISRAFDFIKGIQAGLVTVNLPSAGVEYQLPFGGTKGSSFGPKEQGAAALEFYSDYQTIYLGY
ncbi:MAG: aldehyde dehydrogenase family protein [Cyanophyceae cyanobacterium]